MKVKEEELNEQFYFSTSDLTLAVTLSSYYAYPIISIDTSNPSRAVFYFQRDNGLDQLIQKFWAKELLVEPITFFTSLRLIKSRIAS